MIDCILHIQSHDRAHTYLKKPTNVKVRYIYITKKTENPAGKRDVEMLRCRDDGGGEKTPSTNFKLNISKLFQTFIRKIQSNKVSKLQ